MKDYNNCNISAIQNSTIDSLPKVLINMIVDLCEDGMPTEETIQQWLLTKPGEWGIKEDE